MPTKLSLRMSDEDYERFKKSIDSSTSIHGHVLKLIEKHIAEFEQTKQTREETLLQEIKSLPPTEQTALLMTIRNKCKQYKKIHGTK